MMEKFPTQNSENEIPEEDTSYIEMVEGRLEGQTVTLEVLRGNFEKLNANIGEIEKIPKSVLESPEGQKETQSLRSKVAERVKGLGNTIVQKLAKLDDWKTKDAFVKYAGAAGISMMVGPALIQYARSQYPEVGVLLDSAPDALQQIIHFDAWAHIANLFTDDSVETIWKGGSIEAGNLLADISSGKVDITLLSNEQMEMLQGSIGDMADLIKDLAAGGKIEKARSLAEGSSVSAGIIKGGFGNAPLFAYAAGATYWLSSKLGGMARNKAEANNK